MRHVAAPEDVRTPTAKRAQEPFGIPGGSWTGLFSILRETFSGDAVYKNRSIVFKKSHCGKSGKPLNGLRNPQVVYMSDGFEVVFDAEQQQISGLLIRDGVYYGQLPASGEQPPLLIALHGITSNGEALFALESLRDKFTARFPTAPISFPQVGVD